jgi:phage shock protein B
MHGVFIAAIVFGGLVLGLAVIGGTFLMAIRLLKGGVSRRQQRTEAEEARMIQEIYKGLSRMEERVETLETILLDHGKGRTTDAQS